MMLLRAHRCGGAQAVGAAFTAYMDKTMEYFLQWGEGRDLPPGYEWYAEAAQNSDRRWPST